MPSAIIIEHEGLPLLRTTSERPISLAHPVRFPPSATTSAFSLPRPTCDPVTFPLDSNASETEGPFAFIGSVARGGSVECRVVKFCPHGAGTHTECASHVLGMDGAREGGWAQHVTDVDVPPFSPALVVTVAPVRRGDCSDAYPHPGHPEDLVISRESLCAAVEASRVNLGSLKGGKAAAVEGRNVVDLGLPLPQDAGCALVLRVPFSPRDKVDEGDGQAEDWDGSNPPYLTRDCAAEIRSLGFQHLVTNLPSVDRGDDGGALGAHREIFLGGGHAQTITELARVPVHVSDGVYVLQLRISRFVLDAAPSEPLLFACKKV